MLHIVDWGVSYLRLRHHIGSTLQGQAVQEELDCLTLEDRTDRLFRNVGIYQSLPRNIPEQGGYNFRYWLGLIWMFQECSGNCLCFIVCVSWLCAVFVCCVLSVLVTNILVSYKLVSDGTLYCPTDSYRLFLCRFFDSRSCATVAVVAVKVLVLELLLKSVLTLVLSRWLRYYASVFLLSHWLVALLVLCTYSWLLCLSLCRRCLAGVYLCCRF
jgi:hypothetical protein